jgi:acetolactate synthase I/II/III large subunit
MKGYEAIPELLLRAGHQVVFSMLGGTNVHWLAHGVRGGALRLVKVRHEENAVNAAAGYAKVTGGPGVCTVSRGPGFTNALTALAAAAMSHHPVLMVVSESPTPVRTQQQVDQRGLCRIAGAGFHQVDTVDTLEESFWRAWQAARWNGQPQVLSLADRVFDQAVELTGTEVAARDADLEPDPVSVSACVRALRTARRPLVLAGQGAALAGCREELATLAEVSGAALATTLIANRLFAGHPRDLGLCGDWSPPLSREAIGRADLVLAFGASLNHNTTAGGGAFKDATVVHCEIDLDRPCLASAPEYALPCDARGAARALLAEWRRQGSPDRPAPGPLPSWTENRQALLDADIGADPARGLDPRQVFDLFDRCLPADRIVVTDHGRSLGAVLPSMVDAVDERSWLTGSGFGAVGRGIGLAVGAAAADRGRRVLLFAGDGGFAMSLHDLDAFRINGLEAVIVIVNDEQYGAENRHLTSRGLPTDIVQQSLPDVGLLARSFGGTGLVLRDSSDLDAVALPDRGLVLVDARTDPEANVRVALE